MGKEEVAAAIEKMVDEEAMPTVLAGNADLEYSMIFEIVPEIADIDFNFPLFGVAPPEDYERLFVIHKGGEIHMAAPFARLPPGPSVAATGN